MLSEIFMAAGATIALWISARFYFSSRFGVCRSKKDMSGKTVIITGANIGVGLETARDLAKRNARVILACRNLEKGRWAVRNIVRTTGNNNVLLKKLDLSSFQSVRAFAEDILQSESRLDVLVNNAGIVTPKRQLTEDNIELTMATNHYGHFLLTNLLLPLLKKSTPSRVVIVASSALKVVNIDFNNLNSEKGYSSLKVYARSKLANVLFMRELATRLKETGVTANALHPGATGTGLFRDLSVLTAIIIRVLFWPVWKNPTEGAQTIIHCCVAEELENINGKFFVDCTRQKLWKHARSIRSYKRLWEHSEIVTGIPPVEEKND